MPAIRAQLPGMIFFIHFPAELLEDFFPEDLLLFLLRVFLHVSPIRSIRMASATTQPDLLPDS